MAGASAASASSGESSGNEGGGADGAGQVTDYSELLEQAQSELGQTQEELGYTKQELATIRQATEQNQRTLDSIRQIFAPDNRAAPTKGTKTKARAERMMEEFLQAALADKSRGGTGLPLTTTLATEFFQKMMEDADENEKLRSDIEELKKQTKRATDPSAALDLMAFADFDGKIMSALNTVYGAGDEYGQQKDAQYKAICMQIEQEIRDLKENDPDVWDRVRRNGTDRAKMVGHFVKLNIPPKARELLEEQQIRDTPLTLEDTYQAFLEAKELARQNPSNPEYKALKAELGREVLVEISLRNRGGRAGGGGGRRIGMNSIL